MKVIVSALSQEARAVARALDLKKDPASGKIPVYANGDTLLVVSGMGKARAAAAAAFALQRAGIDSETQLINVGMCGAASGRFSLGQPLVMNKIRERTTGRDCFPDMLFRWELEEASLETWDQPVTKSLQSQVACDTVDMEAFGVFQAGMLFLAPHQLLFLKVVSDYLDFSTERFPQMLQYFEQGLVSCLPVLNRAFTVSSGSPALDKEGGELVEKVAANLRLTSTQVHRLNQEITGYLVRGGRSLSFLHPYLKRTPAHKAQRNQTFEKLILDLRR